MRRKINKNSVIIIIIVAIFTLSSYSFDQLVIRNEDKIRNLQIKLENTITEIENYHSIENQLISLSDLSLNEYVHLKRSNKYWLKSIIRAKILCPLLLAYIHIFKFRSYL